MKKKIEKSGNGRMERVRREKVQKKGQSVKTSKKWKEENNNKVEGRIKGEEGKGTITKRNKQTWKTQDEDEDENDTRKEEEEEEGDEVREADAGREGGAPDTPGVMSIDHQAHGRVTPTCQPACLPTCLPDNTAHLIARHSPPPSPSPSSPL